MLQFGEKRINACQRTFSGSVLDLVKDFRCAFTKTAQSTFALTAYLFVTNFQFKLAFVKALARGSLLDL